MSAAKIAAARAALADGVARDVARDVAREARWLIATFHGDQSVALRTCRHRAANASNPTLAQFWQDVAAFIVAGDLGWRLR